MTKSFSSIVNYPLLIVRVANEASPLCFFQVETRRSVWLSAVSDSSDCGSRNVGLPICNNVEWHCVRDFLDIHGSRNFLLLGHAISRSEQLHVEASL